MPKHFLIEDGILHYDAHDEDDKEDSDATMLEDLDEEELAPEQEVYPKMMMNELGCMLHILMPMRSESPTNNMSSFGVEYYLEMYMDNSLQI